VLKAQAGDTVAKVAERRVQRNRSGKFTASPNSFCRGREIKIPANDFRHK
jgi:hypothetical protein